MPHLSPLVLLPMFAAFLLFAMQSYGDHTRSMWTPNLVFAALSVITSVCYIVTGLAGLLTASVGLAYLVLGAALLAGAALELALHRSL